ncbi:MAG: hypothetical protein M1812_004176 [Candelaria pacifica]|nr:MAG: hypothetical protein M1812_004176 [Candelaria pacifica]
MPPSQKIFIPLGPSHLSPPPTRTPTNPPSLPENNPEVFTNLVHTLGVSPNLHFIDIYSLSEPSLLAAIPRPVYGLIFICPGSSFHRARDAENDAMAVYEGKGDKPMWFKQTIGNACGLIALLHAVCNGGAKRFIIEGSELDRLVKEAKPLGVEERARLLYDSEVLEMAHMQAARLGDSEAPTPEEFCPLHFIAFVKGEDGHLWELNGGMKGPVDRGVLGEREDALSERALEMGVKTFLDKGGDGEGDVRFSIVALVGTGDGEES